MLPSRVDVAVIGGGIGGIAAAYFLAPSVSVAVLEMEPHVGMHATGRSAALYVPNYGNAVVRALTRASRSFLLSPPEKFCDAPLVQPRGLLQLARVGQQFALDKMLQIALPYSPTARVLDATEVTGKYGFVRESTICGALWLDDTMELDVNALLTGFLRGAKSQRATIVTDCRVERLEHSAGRWLVHTPRGRLEADAVLNAAGAWADGIALAAGGRALGIQPKRRTAAIVPAPAGQSVQSWPFVTDYNESFYFKPDAGKLLVSPADETPMAPCDAYPEDIDVAIAIERISELTSIEINRVERSWAGLRSFAADRSPVIGADPVLPRFFWSAGQGGYGVQTAVAWAQLAAALVIGNANQALLEDFGIEESQVLPQRLLSA